MKHYLVRRPRYSIVISSSVLVLGVVVSALMGVVFTQQPEPARASAVELSFTQIATHPYASKAGYAKGTRCPSADFCPAGQSLTDMAIDSNGVLVAGYGDWGGNVDSWGVPEGRVGVVPYNIQTNTWGTMFYAGSEALDTVRVYDGAFYLPSTDPSNNPATGQTVPGGGYITNASGSWRLVRNENQPAHVFDVQKVSQQEYWMFGSKSVASGSSEGVATAWRSTNGGATWQVAKQDTSQGATNQFERYYWGALLNNSMYMHAHSTTPATPMRIYNRATDTWHDGQTAPFCASVQTNRYVILNNRLICGDGAVRVFDGQEVRSFPTPNASPIEDFYIDNDQLYILTYNNALYRFDSVTEEFTALSSPSGVGVDASSLAVYQDTIYLGGSRGEIWKSTTTITNAPAARPYIYSVSPSTIPLDGKKHTVIIDGRNLGLTSQVTVGGQAVSMTGQAFATQIVIEVDASLFTAGTMGVSSTNTNGIVATLDNAITFVKSPIYPGGNAPPASIASVEVMPRAESNDTVRLHVTGSHFIEPLVITQSENEYWAVGMRTRLVSLNGQIIPACMDPDAYAVLQNYYNTSFFTKDGPCYQLIDYDMANNVVVPLMNNVSFDVIVPKTSSAAQHGTVQLVGGTYGSARLLPSNQYIY